MALNCKNLYRIGPRSTISSEGGGQKAERGKVRGIFFQVGGRRAEGGGGRKETKKLPFSNAHCGDHFKKKQKYYSLLKQPGLF